VRLWQVVFSGATASGDVMAGGGEQVVEGGGTAIGETVSGGGVQVDFTAARGGAEHDLVRSSGLAVVSVCLPRGRIVFVCLVSPRSPVLAGAPREEFQIRS
jgi:autotransporter passenger strand-loop-strand repeat protein